MNRFPRVLGVRTGYDPDQVDALIQRIEATLGRGVLDGPPITADEIRNARFRTKLGGYHELAVDYALDAFVIAVEIHGQSPVAPGVVEPGPVPSPASSAAPSASSTVSPVSSGAPSVPRPRVVAHPVVEPSREKSAFEPFRPARARETPARETPRAGSLFEPATPMSAFSAPQAAPVPERTRAAPAPAAPDDDEDDAPTLPGMPKVTAQGPIPGEAGSPSAPGRGGPGESASGQGGPGQSVPGQGAPGQGGPGQGVSGQGGPGRSVPGQGGLSAGGPGVLGAAGTPPPPPMAGPPGTRISTQPGTGSLAAAWLEEQATRVERVLFRPARLGAGYNEDEVDVFLDHVVATLRGTSEHALTAEQVRKATFSTVVFKTGYAVTQVDAFLAEVAGVLDRREALVGEQEQHV
ncbi:DivIVA domain-containing protein [Sphaerisporangium dianthi]|uniref:DivIVA domain-containing protein n=1 Tax=Sphaerisporangium dianthi TaxID=1436120 RepID=A0ABV9CT94_9ACTN